MKNCTLLSILIILAGCTSRTLEVPTKAGPLKYKSRRFAANEQFADILITEGTNSFRISGVKSDLVSGFQAGTDAALKIISAAKP